MHRLKLIGSMRSSAARVSTAISIFLLVIAFLLLFSGRVGTAGLPSFAITLKAVTVLILAYLSYRIVLKRIGIIKITARNASPFIAIADLALGYFYIGECTILSGIAMFVTWIILSV